MATAPRPHLARQNTEPDPDRPGRRYLIWLGLSLNALCIVALAAVAYGRAKQATPVTIAPTSTVAPPATRGPLTTVEVWQTAFIELTAEIGTELAQATATAMDTATPIPMPVLYNDDWPPVLTNGIAYKGREVNLTGKILADPEVRDDVLALQMFTTNHASAGTTIVLYGVKVNFKTGDYVHVLGTVFDEFEGRNELGDTIHAPVVWAHFVTTIPRAVAVAPARLTQNFYQALDQRGLVITLGQIEFADEETRIHVDVANKSNRLASLQPYGALLAQGNRQFAAKSNFGSGYPDLPSTMLPGITAEGVLSFEPLDPEAGEARFVWDGPYLEGYSFDFAPYQWNLSWPMPTNRYENGTLIPGKWDVNTGKFVPER